MLRKLFASITILLLTGGAAFAHKTTITSTLTDIAAGADRHDWDRVRAAFADAVTTDYSSLWGGDPVTQSANDLIKAWEGFLPGFDNTHHMLTNHTVTEMSETSAMAEADFTATHRIDDALWVLGGRYTYALEMIEERWVVSALTMTALWETGDRGLVAIAGERAAAAN